MEGHLRGIVNQLTVEELVKHDSDQHHHAHHDITFRVVPVSQSVRMTPVRPGGTAAKIIDGSIAPRN